MSRNKENIPLTSSQRLNDSLLSSSKHLASDEFFTDSLVDITQLSSRIPSPSPQKPAFAKARRAQTIRTTRNAPNPLSRSSASESVVPRLRNKNLQPVTPLRNGLGLTRLRTSSVTTPPSSKGDLPLASPYTSISSPPSQDLTDAYRQIEDEEDLAQTEREVSSDDSNASEPGDLQPIRLNQRSKSESPPKPPPTFTLPSRASTPTRSTCNPNKQKRLSDRAESLSEASGLSFLQDMTDRVLAEKMTPHVTETAKDKARWREIAGQKPIAFSKARIPRRTEATGTASSIPVSVYTKPVAFSQAVKPPPNRFVHGSQCGDPENSPRQQYSGAESQDSINNVPHVNDQPQQILPTNTRIERQFNFSTNFGFPDPRPALTEKNLEQQNRRSPNLNPSLRSQSSAASLLSDPSGSNTKILGEGARLTNGHVSRLPQFRKSTQLETKPIPEEQSQIDWTAAAADVPVPSVETSFDSGKKDSTPISYSKLCSPEKSRRWDNDFTGQSFQVSESPPVRHKPIAQEQKRDKEIEGVAKQAVTTSRLSEIRERQPLESLRSFSKSPASHSASRSSEPKTHQDQVEENNSEVVGEAVPDTPVVIYRSSSNSGSDRASKVSSLEHPNMDRGKSHDHLQRLAKAMSTTPRSSPASGSGSKDIADKALLLIEDKKDSDDLLKKLQDAASPEVSNQVFEKVAQTPRVAGAWTDTILPDTIKTAKQAGKEKVYVQTPHVSAGGWIDTPAPVEKRRLSGTIPTIIEEVPEELTAGFVKDTAISETGKIQVLPDSKVAVLSQPQQLLSDQPKSALAAILDQQKHRLLSRDIASAGREDTLNLGNETIESLQDLLELNEDDITILSRLSLADDDTKSLSEVQKEAKLLRRMVSSIGRLRDTVDNTHKGISEIEQQVFIPTAQQLLNDTICQICNQQTFQPHIHPESRSKYFPFASLTFSLPIPLLFHPRVSGQLLPRPTPLGALTLAVWLWYMVENTMCEIYCRPEYTDFYVWPAEPEPEFPFVLPTMLARWTRINHLALGSLILWFGASIARLVRAFLRVVAMSLGWTDGFAADDTTSRVVKMVVETTMSVAATATGVDMSMNDDVYI